MRGIPSSARCGTYGGYQAHRRRGEEACSSCTDARRRYLATYRAKNASARRRDRAQAAAYNRAEKQLRNKYRDEFEELYRAALAEAMTDYHEDEEQS